MPRDDAHESHRFVVLYRREPRELHERNGPTEEWRGWVSRVPDRVELVRGVKEERLSFRALQDLPDLIRMLVEQARRE